MNRQQKSYKIIIPLCSPFHFKFRKYHDLPINCYNFVLCQTALIQIIRFSSIFTSVQRVMKYFFQGRKEIYLYSMHNIKYMLYYGLISLTCGHLPVC